MIIREFTNFQLEYFHLIKMDFSDVDLGDILPIVALAVAALIIATILLRRKKGPQTMIVKLIEKEKLTHDTIIFTYALPDASKKLNLKVGEHIQIQESIKGELVKRKYTPISGVDRVGSFQLLLKVYQPDPKFPQGGKMSTYLAQMPPNDNITITLPYGRFHYLGKSMTQITNFEGKKINRKYEHLYMVAGGTGITPIYQIIQYACQHEREEDMPRMTLLFANRSEDDILLESDLKMYAEKHPKFECFFSVDKSVTEDWKGFVGFINEQKITQTAPKDISKTLFLSCGPPILSNIVEKIWVSSLKVPISQIHRF